ncbi:L-selectin-like [Labrus mixtus]|uniref:L-selectin-like n=1 Tax=Labrus mixtus TaxID=508554 RepID=UPI0029C08D9E|nr:L-selectin-like [Labrus mixtus]
MKRLIAAVGSGYEGNVWIGLHDPHWDWKWLLSDKSFYGNESNFRKWNTNPSSNATQGFVLINQELSWWRALLYCKANHTVLASVRNDQENSEIQQLVGDEQFVWIGLYRRTWSSWSGGANSKFQNWVDGHPRNLTESCGASVFDANHNGEWVEKYCKYKLPFICHTKKHMMIFKMTTLKSTIDLNDPAVTDAILNLIKEKIREQGVTGDFNISWRKRSGEHVFRKEEKNSDDVKIEGVTCNKNV